MPFFHRLGERRAATGEAPHDSMKGTTFQSGKERKGRQDRTEETAPPKPAGKQT